MSKRHYPAAEGSKEVPMRVHPLYTKFSPETVNKILGQDRCELELDFPGFADVYNSLSRVIPRHFTVIDFGCYLATQCWYFRRHKAYIGVDLTELERFSMPNVTHYVARIEDWIAEHRNSCTAATFAICSYVGLPSRAVADSFSNVFCYYPERDYSERGLFRALIQTVVQARPDSY